MADNKEFKGFNHGTGSVALGLANATGLNTDQKRPVQIHLKEDGAIGDKPSFCLVLTNGREVTIGQISLEMFNEGLADIGYKLVKDETRDFGG